MNRIVTMQHSGRRVVCLLLFSWAVTAQGQPSITINGKPNGITVDEGDPVTFKCQANGNPLPTLRLYDSERRQYARRRSPISYRVLASSCEDSRRYYCSVINGTGPNATPASTMLYVTCRPRSSLYTQTANYRGVPVDVTFIVTAYPAPNVHSIYFAGLSGEDQMTGVPVAITLTNRGCQRSNVYKHICTVVVQEVQSLAAEGYYSVTIVNNVGSANFSLRINAIMLLPCGVDKTIEIVRGRTDNRFYCQGYDESQYVEWTVKQADGTDFFAGKCLPDASCSRGLLYPAFIPQRTSSKNYILVDPTKLSISTLVETGSLICKDSDTEVLCRMDYITPVQGNCIAQFSNKAPWQVHGQCNVTAGRSVRNRYHCHWYRLNMETNEESLETVQMDHANLPTSGSCVFRGPQPSEKGHYSYRTVFVPGRISVDVRFLGNNEIDQPAVPVISCDSNGFVAEQQTVSCRCTTSKLGQPTGYLIWSRGRNDVFDVSNPLVTGAYGDTMLTLTTTPLTLLDHNVTSFRCEVAWIRNIPGDFYLAQVGYPSRKPVFTINSEAVNLTVKENEVVTFECSANDGRPPPTLKLVYRTNNTELFQHLDTITYTISRAQCEDGGKYECAANNGIGGDTHTSKLLYVQCKPRSPSLTLKLPPYINRPLAAHFDVIAYPSPEVITFAFLGQSGNETPQDIQNISMTGLCDPKTDVVHTSLCSVIVENVTDPSARGFYRVRVSNALGYSDFLTEVKLQERASLHDMLPLIVGPSLVASFLVIVIVIIVLVRRRGHCLFCRSKSTVSRQNHQDGRDVADDLASLPGLMESTGHYSSLQMSEVGVRKIYSGLAEGDNPSACDAGPYSQLQASDVGLRSNYTGLEVSDRSNAHDAGMRSGSFGRASNNLSDHSAAGCSQNAPYETIELSGMVVPVECSKHNGSSR